LKKQKAPMIPAVISEIVHNQIGQSEKDVHEEEKYDIRKNIP
jgi:hypothetical protein